MQAAGPLPAGWLQTRIEVTRRLYCPHLLYAAMHLLYEWYYTTTAHAMLHTYEHYATLCSLRYVCLTIHLLHLPHYTAVRMPKGL